MFLAILVLGHPKVVGGECVLKLLYAKASQATWRPDWKSYKHFQDRLLSK